MKVGAWHQFGDRSQKLALEQLQNHVGVGVIISPRDLARPSAVEYSEQYRALGSDVLADPQFYIPESNLGKLSTHETAAFRMPTSQLIKLNDAQIGNLGEALRTWNAALKTSAVIAPAIIYEAGRPDVVDLNARLFKEAKKAAEAIGVPVYATAVVGRSAANSDITLSDLLASITNLDPDGWYYSFEFEETRIPRSAALIERFLRAGLVLACTGKPVMHAFAGPLSLLSRCCGMTAAAIGHSQNVWQFTQSRWQAAEGSGGGGAAPPRLYCPALCGTIVYEDEFALVAPAIRTKIHSPSPFSNQVKLTPPFLPWPKWEASKHLVHSLCTSAQSALEEPTIAAASSEAIDTLKNAIALHKSIATAGISLTDDTNTYQSQWLSGLNGFLANSATQIDFFGLL